MVWFLVLICVVVGLMVWEVARITSPEDDRAAQVIGALAGLAVLIATKFPLGFALPVLFLPGLVGGSRFEDSRGIFTFYTAMICVAGFGLYDLRVNFGMVWMFWLAAVVIATDVFGYFGGA